jgi:translation initiation factor 1
MSTEGPRDPPKPFNNPFAGLAGARQSLPAGRAAPAERRGPARAVVRMERKGHGGKEVTVVEKLELRPKELEQWLRELKQALGCGGTVDGADLVLQGDQRERVQALLAARGVGRISVG